MKKKFFLFHVLFLISLFKAQTVPNASENYIYTKNYLDYPLSGSPKVSETIEYFDGLGRVKQVVDIRATPQGKDLVTFIPYDSYGNQTESWLPVPINTLNGGIHQNVGSAVTAFYGDAVPFGHKNIEASPLNRITSQFQSGSAWQNNPVTLYYSLNKSTDKVARFITTTKTVNNATFSTLEWKNYYADNQLSKNTTIDEDGNKTIEFKNGEDQIILIRKVLSDIETADTYYVYNEYNQLAFVIAPNSIKEYLENYLPDSNDQEFPDHILDDLCYQYRYDGKGRLVERKLPGKGWEYMVYDKASRLILTQDANMRASSKWFITKYDIFGRAIYTGMLSGGSRTDMQSQAANLVISESKDSTGFLRNGMSIYYTNNYFTNIETVYTINYYDTYPLGSSSIPDQILGQTVLPQPSSSVANTTNSLATASYIKNIEDDNWTKNYTFYDLKGRTIGTNSINNFGGYTKTESELDFSGTVKRIITKHKLADPDTEKVIQETFGYDNHNRLLTHKHRVDNFPEEYLAQNDYDELSQLKNKKVGGTIFGSGVQSIDYQYNLKGWMTAINNIDDLDNKLFAYQIKYENPSSTNFSKKKYNGNISEVNWKSSTDDLLRRYEYHYDKLNRITSSIFSEPSTDIPYKYLYGEDILYDLNGNITTLLRTGNQYSTSELIDDLSYNYYGNKVVVIYDHSQNSSGYPGGGNVISYDENGNMITMPDKKINSIAYNYRNLPSSISEGTGKKKNFINYTYNADGIKLKKEITSATLSSQSSITYYIDGFQYDNIDSSCFNCPASQPILKLLPTSEGYYNFENNKYIYNYTDHLGNIRVTFQQQGNGVEVLEENNYYSSGLKHDGYNIFSGNPSYRYKYNGKEEQENGMYDYGTRFYMPDIARWGVIDPLAEKMTRYSPYNYAFDNPVNFIDPDGREPTGWVYNIQTHQIYWNEDAVSQGTAGVNETYLGTSGTYTAYDGSTTLLNENGTPTNNSLAKGLGLFTDLDPLIQAGASGPKLSALMFRDPNAPTMGPIPDSRGKTEIQMLVAENPLVQSVIIGAATGGITNWLLRSLSSATVPAAGTLSEARALGQAGEEAVGITGAKKGIQIGDKMRFPDRLTATTLEEVKNVKNQSFTRQLRDYLNYSQQTNREMILHTRPTTKLSGPLKQAIESGQITHKFIPQ